jgi:hypothetical protein
MWFRFAVTQKKSRVLADFMSATCRDFTRVCPNKIDRVQLYEGAGARRVAMETSNVRIDQDRRPVCIEREGCFLILVQQRQGRTGSLHFLAHNSTERSPVPGTKGGSPGRTYGGAVTACSRPSAPRSLAVAKSPAARQPKAMVIKSMDLCLRGALRLLGWHFAYSPLHRQRSRATGHFLRLVILTFCLGLVWPGRWIATRLSDSQQLFGSEQSRSPGISSCAVAGQ